MHIAYISITERVVSTNFDKIPLLNSTMGLENSILSTRADSALNESRR